MKERAREKIEDFSDFFRNNKVLTAYWLVFTAIILFQHTQGWNWDFLVYLMNGEYIFHSGEFMEWLRPPLAPVIMGLLQFAFSRTMTGYVYIFLVSVFFLYAAKRFSESEGLDTLVFTVFLSTPVFISYATREGTELLALSFLMLFLADLDSEKAGGWLGMSILTRWTQGMMLPLVLLQRDLKKILRTGLVFGSVFVPWMLYCYYVVGDPLVSPISFISVNILLGNLTTPPVPSHFLIMTFPSALAALLLLKEKVREKIRASLRKEETSWAMAYIVAAITFVYFASDVTHLRYLFALNLPLAFFAAKAWEEVDRKKLIYGFMAVNLLLGFQAALDDGYESKWPYQRAAGEIDCMVESDSWVPLNYAGLNAESPVNDETTVERIEEGWRVLDFTGTLINSEEERQAGELLRDEGAYKVYGIPGRCAGPVKVDNTRIGEYNTAHGTNYTETGFMLRLLLGKQF